MNLSHHLSRTVRSPSAVPQMGSIVASFVFLCGTALAAPQTWVPLSANSPPGTPATVALDPAASSGTETWIDIRIHGYWQSVLTGPDSLTYMKIEVPGLGRIGQVGAPDLPAVRPRIAFATNSSILDLVSAQAMSSVTTNGVRIHPFGIEGNDDPPDPTVDPGPGDPNGTDEEFKKDPAIYALTTSWPPTVGIDPILSESWLGQIRSASAEIYPIRCIPSGPGMSYTIATWLRCRYVHAGVPVAQPAITKDMAKVCAASVINWPELAPWFQADTTTYKGRYLFVVPSEYHTALQPLVDHRKACGYATTTIVLAGGFPFPFQNIRNIIDNWRDAGAPGFEHFCLLVGDTDKIPLCPSPTDPVKYGDDPYGSPDGVASLDEDVFVGRLSVDSAADLTVQIAKILNYELHPKVGGHYERAVLVSHEEDAPGKYQGNCETVANAMYAVPPTFVKRYGATVGNDNSDVVSALNQGCGIVSYRGHGSTNTWYHWNLLNEHFHKNDVVALEDQPFLPIVWSFSCTNQNLDFQSGSSVDSIGENWVEHPIGGAAAHYGSTAVSKTNQNHSLHEFMFRSIFQYGITTHSQAIAVAEELQVAFEPGLNPWLYLLLGDPVMKIRRGPPSPPVIDGPDSITASQNGQTLLFQVTSASGAPLPGVLVSVFKESWPPSSSGVPEILGNAYSGTSGTAVIPIGPTTFGSIHTIGRDDDGNVASGIIPVNHGPWKDLGGGKYGGNGKPKLGGTGSLKPNTANSIDLYDAPANRPAILFVSFGSNPQPFFGGTLHTLPLALALNATTDGAGRVLIAIPSWPANVPAGTTLFMQYAIDDPAAAFGVGLSNGLRAVTP